MFKVKEIKTKEIITVLDCYCDEFGKTWFLIWKDKWLWRAANEYCPPNYNPPIKLIIAGTRNFCNFSLLNKEMTDFVKENNIGEVVCGEAKGADTLGKNWAISENIKVKSFPANWEQYGNRAGFIRNHEMGDYADELIAFWDGMSTGTKDMIDYMTKLGKPCKIVYI